MKKTLAVMACALALVGSAVSQRSSSKKPSGAVREDATDSRSKPAFTLQDDTATVKNPAYAEKQKPALQTRQLSESPAIPTGTAIRMKLQSAISTHQSQDGDTFTGRVTEDVVVDGNTVIPAGASLSGRVTRLSEPRRFAGVPSIDLRPETVTLPNGTAFNITAMVVDTGNPKLYTVTDEGRIKGKGRTKADNIVLAGATGSGAVAGAIFGGGVGSVVGAAVGASASTGSWLIKRNSEVLPAGTEIIMELSRPIAVEGEQ